MVSRGMSLKTCFTIENGGPSTDEFSSPATNGSTYSATERSLLGCGAVGEAPTWLLHLKVYFVVNVFKNNIIVTGLTQATVAVFSSPKPIYILTAGNVFKNSKVDGISFQDC